MNSLKRRVFLAGLAGMSVAAAMLARPVAAGEVAALRVGGSTTLLPIVATAASQFMEKYKTWDKVDPSLPAEQFTANADLTRILFT